MSTTHTDRDSLAPPRVEDLGEGLYAYIQPNGTWMINNTGFLVARDGVVCVDGSSTERRTRALIDAVAGVTDRPIRTLLNTHSHHDHVAGNGLFTGATIVAHEGVRTDMLGPPLPIADIWEPFERGELTVTPPFLTYRDEVTLWVDELRCEVRHVGRAAHTTNDSYVWVPQRRVLYSGDLIFHGGTPFCVAGSVAGTIDVLTEQIAPLRPELIVPGHGELCGPGVIEDVAGYLRFVMDTARAGIDAGLSPLDAARETDLGRYGEWTDTERIVGNLHRAYVDLGQPPVSLAEALRDMVTYNGGRPLTCLA